MIRVGADRLAPMGLTAGNINSGINPGESQTGGMYTQSTPRYSRCEKNESYTEYSTNCEPGTCIPDKEIYEELGIREIRSELSVSE